MDIPRGSIFGLLGPNGAGKTTSFYMIVGLVASDSGSIHLNSDDLTHLPMDQRARRGLGYLPQEASVFRKLSVEQNIKSVLEILKHLTPDQRTRRLEGLLREFNIGHIRETMGMSLSGGERGPVFWPYDNSREENDHELLCRFGRFAERDFDLRH